MLWSYLIETGAACLKFTVVETFNCHSSHTLQKSTLQNSTLQHVSTLNDDYDSSILGIWFSKMTRIDSALNSPVTAKWSLFLGRLGTGLLLLGDITSMSPGMEKGSYCRRLFSSISGEINVFLRESSPFWSIPGLPLPDVIWCVWNHSMLLEVKLIVRVPLRGENRMNCGSSM